MKKFLLASILSVLPFASNANDFNIKPVVGLDCAYAKINLQNGWQRIAEEKYHSASAVIGIKLNDTIGLEAFYQQSLEETITPISTKFNAFGFDSLAYIPINDTIDVVPSFGIARYKVEASVKGLLSVNEDRLGLRGGIGAQINFNENVGLRISGRFVYFDDLDSVDSLWEISTGLRFTF